MADTFFKIEGVKDIQRILEEIAPKHARALMRTTIHGVASKIAKDAKQLAPKGKTNTLRRAIKSRRRRGTPDKPVSVVYITTGNQAAHDAFYWRFVEYGTGGGKGSHLKGFVMDDAKPFIRPALEAARANFNTILITQFKNKLKKKLAVEAKKTAKKKAKK